jgi:wobble nucleotide-excising tRNase
MIKKIFSIENFGIFQNFEWDNFVKDTVGKPLLLNKINILYGRNYSGKTTLSRIFGSLENGYLPEKYESPKFSLLLKDKSYITENDLTTHNLDIRVFNEDFIKRNLSFLFDPKGIIAPFAILGETNATILKDIENLKDELGINIEGKETKLYLEKLGLSNGLRKKHTELENKKKEIDLILTNKATKATNSIKNKHEIYGDIRYDVTKLKKELDIVNKLGYVPLKDIEIERYFKIIKEQVKLVKPNEFNRKLLLNEYIKKSTSILNKKLETSNKIKELIDDALLNEWVKQGSELLDKKQICTFCGGIITKERWKIIHAHFDNETQKLEQEINDLILKIKTEQEAIERFVIDKNAFYLKYEEQICNIEERYQIECTKYLSKLTEIIEKLKIKKTNIIKQLDINVTSNEEKLSEIILLYESLRWANDKYSKALESDKNQAKEKIRLHSVYEFKNEINYEYALKSIKTLTNELEEINLKLKGCQQIILLKEEKLKSYNRQLQNEEAGAIAVNKYLSNDFGHSSLNLRAEKSAVDGDEKEIKFCIYRKDKPAYNLSGGEQNLIAFCYFLAKLKDVETVNKKPIIWIDDPITSLDGNHIFFIYSLIVSEITTNDIFDQLFLSTHNLDFLKYLKRLKSIESITYLLVNQIEENKSIIEKMPVYLKDYATEFNYLFKEIYNCSNIVSINDSNYKTLYSFANNARKFIEILMFYNFPFSDSSNKNDFFDKMELFFGQDKIPALLTERITNEYSHLANSVERGQIPIEKSEILTCAKEIIKALENYNKPQFDYLVKSITG